MAYQIDSNATLWQNVLALMTSKYGGRSIKPFAAFCGVGVGTIQRIEKQETSVGLETLDKIAQKFDLAPWQLLVPGFDPSDPPVLQPVNRIERELNEKMMKLAKEIAAHSISHDQR